MFTTFLPNRQRSTALVFIAATGAALLAIASCGSGDSQPAGAVPSDDASVSDVAEAGPAEAEAGPREAGVDADAAAIFDGGPLPILCATPSCATSLVTITGGLYGEGFCALLQDGTVACWGENFESQLGRGGDAGTSDSPTPARVVGLSDIVSISHTCGIDKSGSIWCWGAGAFLRDPAQVSTTEPVAVKLVLPPARQMAFTTNGQFSGPLSTACADFVDGGVQCWGANDHAQITLPEAGADPTVAFPPQTIEMPQGGPIRDLGVGFAALALRQDGTLLSWGANPPLGRTSSLFANPYPGLVALRGVSSIDVSRDYACATAEGVAYCWGDPLQAAASPYSRLTPAPLAIPDPVVQIATAGEGITAGSGGPYTSQRACACTAKGDIYCWGHNEEGQGGDGMRDYLFTPAKVVGLPAPAAQVRTVNWATCAILTNGRVYCWGADGHGELGNGQFNAPSLVPTEAVMP